MSQVTPEVLRHAMRQWTTGVAVVTSRVGDSQHGMTVNSFISISLDPPLISVTLAHATRTRSLVEKSGLFGVTILAEDQAEIADRFAGRIPDDGDRFAGLELFNLTGEVPLIKAGLVSLDCKVVHTYDMNESTLYVAEVLAVHHTREGNPLVYHNRIYHKLGSG
jgi:flavin reductase (DIM6/NTAB) family NADH-FMN oxidoreductase RutF